MGFQDNVRGLHSRGSTSKASWCSTWERGLDCNFDVWTFYTTLAVIWALTVVALVVKLFHPRGKAPTGTARSCLILTMTSATFSFVESILFLARTPFMDDLDTNPDRSRNRTDSNHVLSHLGSIFLVFALSHWASLWCDVAGALAGPSSTQDVSTKLAVRRLLIVRHGYAAIALWHVPMTMIRVATEFGYGLKFKQCTWVWSVWLFISACCIFTIFAVQMWCFVAKCLRNETNRLNLKGLRLVTLVNFWEQMLYNLCLPAIAVLYFPQHSNKFGRIQLAYFAVYFGLYWMMHIQVLFFFLVVETNDPFHSKRDLDMLLLMPNEGEEPASKNAENPVAIGSPTLSSQSTCDVVPNLPSVVPPPCIAEAHV